MRVAVNNGGSSEGGNSKGKGPCLPLRFSIIITLLLGSNSRSVRKSSIASDRRNSKESSAYLLSSLSKSRYL